MRPPLGLLLDVDGPIASPRTRTVARPRILADLRALLAAGVPVVLNTGRSDAFVAAQVVAPLLALGLPGGARLHAVCEKGAVWATAGPAGLGEVHVDDELAVPDAAHEVVAQVAARHGDLVEVDATKRSMATLEALTGEGAAAFARAHELLDAELLSLLTTAGLGVRSGSLAVPDAALEVPWRIDPSVIASDVESVRVGKDLGARRALGLLAGDGEEPARWWTVGDSRTDYLMADQLHALGHAVTHVDVRPVGAPPDRPYPVLVGGGAGAEQLTDDAAGEALLARLAAEVAGEVAGA